MLRRNTGNLIVNKHFLLALRLLNFQTLPAIYKPLAARCILLLLPPPGIILPTTMTLAKVRYSSEKKDRTANLAAKASNRNKKRSKKRFLVDGMKKVRPD